MRPATQAKTISVDTHQDPRGPAGPGRGRGLLPARGEHPGPGGGLLVLGAVRPLDVELPLLVVLFGHPRVSPSFIQQSCQNNTTAAPPPPTGNGGAGARTRRRPRPHPPGAG